LCQEGQAPRSTTCLKTIQQLVAWCAKNTDFYIISKCNSDEEEQFIREQLLSTPEFGNLRQHEHKLLFCSTLVGRGHIARLLEVACHIDGKRCLLRAINKITNLLIHFCGSKIQCRFWINCPHSSPIYYWYNTQKKISFGDLNKLKFCNKNVLLGYYST
jgi:hypothetical protein